MSQTRDSLYELLPMIYRLRDGENNEVLKSLLTVFAEQIDVVQENIEQLYDDQFIETCAPWVVPYIGDLIAYKTLYSPATKYLSARSEVANTIAYRRRKGTATMLEQLARDVTNWPARVVEFFQLLGTTQWMNHIREQNHYAPDLRQWEGLQKINTAFDTTAHTVDVRNIDTDLGRYNINNIGIFLWRLQAYSLTRSPVLAVTPGHYYFSPLQHDLPLFNKPEAEDEISHLAERINVPEAINRRVMDAYLEDYYGPDKSVQVFLNGAPVPIATIEVCCLRAEDGSWIHDPADGMIAIDPESGRLSLPADVIATNPEVSVLFHYGFSMDIGGGEYERASEFDQSLTPIETVTSPQTLQTALTNLAGEGVVEITDSGRYQETPAITVNNQTRIEVRAANEHRPLILLEDDFVITGGEESVVTLDGLVIAGGRIMIPAADNQLRLLRLRHCTLVPGINLNELGEAVSPDRPSIVVESATVQIEIDNCIIGGLRVAEGAEVSIHNSMIDATASTQVAFSELDGLSAGGPLKITNSTVRGKVHTRIMQLASNCIFDCELAPGDSWPSPVAAERKQSGCVRFSYVPLNARLPRRFRCQPEFAISKAINKAEVAGPVSASQKAAIKQAIANRIQPVFKEERCDQPAYTQLALSTAVEIMKGADDESQMGVQHDLYQPQRETNLRLRLKEYLRFGLSAGIFYET